MRKVRMTRACRKVFAKKAQPNINAMRQQFIMRGGGYL